VGCPSRVLPASPETQIFSGEDSLSGSNSKQSTAVAAFRRRWRDGSISREHLGHKSRRDACPRQYDEISSHTMPIQIFPRRSRGGQGGGGTRSRELSERVDPRAAAELESVQPVVGVGKGKRNPLKEAANANPGLSKSPESHPCWFPIFRSFGPVLTISSYLL